MSQLQTAAPERIQYNTALDFVNAWRRWSLGQEVPEPNADLSQNDRWYLKASLAIREFMAETCPQVGIWAATSREEIEGYNWRDVYRTTAGLISLIYPLQSRLASEFNTWLDHQLVESFYSQFRGLPRLRSFDLCVGAFIVPKVGLQSPIYFSGPRILVNSPLIAFTLLVRFRVSGLLSRKFLLGTFWNVMKASCIIPGGLEHLVALGILERVKSDSLLAKKLSTAAVQRYEGMKRRYVIPTNSAGITARDVYGIPHACVPLLNRLSSPMLVLPPNEL